MQSIKYTYGECHRCFFPFQPALLNMLIYRLKKQKVENWVNMLDYVGILFLSITCT